MCRLIASPPADVTTPTATVAVAQTASVKSRIAYGRMVNLPKVSSLPKVGPKLGSRRLSLKFQFIDCTVFVRQMSSV
jgi:hypothetical protein